MTEGFASSLIEIEEHWSIDDVDDWCDYLESREEARREARRRAEAEAKRGGGL